jgi:hypothetical protein
MARALGCDERTGRNALHAFNTSGVAALQPGSAVPHTLYAAFAPAAERLRALLHHSPRVFGKETNIWPLELAAVSCATGLPATRVTGETIRAPLARLGVGWRRATPWIPSSAPESARQKAPAPV